MTVPASYQFARQYRQAQVETASPTQLVLMLYDGAIRFLSLAKEKMLARDLEGKNTNLIKAQRIVSELLSSLNREKGGPIATNLQDLYVFMLKELVEANLYDKTESIDRVIVMLRDLRESWAQVDRMHAAEHSKGKTNHAG